MEDAAGKFSVGRAASIPGPLRRRALQIVKCETERRRLECEIRHSSKCNFPVQITLAATTRACRSPIARFAGRLWRAQFYPDCIPMLLARCNVCVRKS